MRTPDTVRSISSTERCTSSNSLIVAVKISSHIICGGAITSRDWVASLEMRGGTLRRNPVDLTVTGVPPVSKNVTGNNAAEENLENYQ